MDAFLIKCLTLLLFYGGIVLAVGGGTLYGKTLVANETMAGWLGYGITATAFLAAPFLERNVFYYSSRMLLVSALRRLAGGIFIYFLFATDPLIFREIIFSPGSALDSDIAMWIWGTLVAYFCLAIFFRHLKLRQQLFVHLDR